MTAVASGSAIGAALVNIRQGRGSFYLTNSVAETVTVSLSDSQATGANVANTKQITFVPGLCLP